MAAKYELKRRAERQAQTRQRIVDATVALHQQGGEAAASISAIAQRAGVTRLTVYRHFPDERTLLTACTSQYLRDHPPPDPTTWPVEGATRPRLHRVLAEVYAYHRRTEAMMIQLYRDAPTNPVLQELTQPFGQYWLDVRDRLAADWEPGRSAAPVVRAAVGHALAFQTWQSLVRGQGLNEAEAVDLMVGLVTAAARRQDDGSCGP